TGSVIIALILGEKLPDIKTILIILLLGYVAYGLSIFTYIRAQKTLGAAKTSAYYAIAPFIGVLLSFVVLKESVSTTYIIALLVMLVGTGVIVYETLRYNHKHLHTHVITHTHDGTTHTHIIEHTHAHDHVINEGKHGHSHNFNL
ncbi:MAG: DMT family transporter, partial [Lachnospiraceae bacterium]|nr:DMT family transporter [Lachnospiraceae bacterium]